MTTGPMDRTDGTVSQAPSRVRMIPLMSWFIALPIQRKVLLFLAGGMVTLVFDAFVAHFSWTNLTMRWKQTIPIIYGLLAAASLGVTALFALPPKVHARVVAAAGAVGMAVGLTGVTLHALTVAENLSGEPMAITAIGKALSLSAPLFAPAAFAGVGLLLLVLPKLAPMPR